MKTPKSISEHTFVTIVGIAAFIHSTWTVATFSGGTAPTVSDVVTALSWVWWVLPGALAAFALEIGQISTARQIQRGVGRRFRLFKIVINVKVVTFVLLSAATYLLQLAYLLHHYPDLPIAGGLSATSKIAAAFVMEIIVWGMPLLLPASMLLFTAGDEATVSRSEAIVPLMVSCPECDWTKEYCDPLAAQNGLNGHMRSHSLLPLSSNGKH